MGHATFRKAFAEDIHSTVKSMQCKYILHYKHIVFDVLALSVYHPCMHYSYSIVEANLLQRFDMHTIPMCIQHIHNTHIYICSVTYSYTNNNRIARRKNLRRVHFKWKLGKLNLLKSYIQSVFYPASKWLKLLMALSTDLRNNNFP